MKIFIVEDEENIVRLLKDELMRGAIRWSP